MKRNTHWLKLRDTHWTEKNIFFSQNDVDPTTHTHTTHIYTIMLTGNRTRSKSYMAAIASNIEKTHCVYDINPTNHISTISLPLSATAVEKKLLNEIKTEMMNKNPIGGLVRKAQQKWLRNQFYSFDFWISSIAIFIRTLVRLANVAVLMRCQLSSL